MQNAASSAVLVAGWHRMGYQVNDQSHISTELEKHIRKLHSIVGNAVTEKRFIVFGAGSSQLLNAAVHALSQDKSTSPAGVVATFPFYPVLLLPNYLGFNFNKISVLCLVLDSMETKRFLREKRNLETYGNV